MRSITIDIINEKAMDLLKDLESLELIKLRENSHAESKVLTDWSSYKGSMQKQPIEDIDNQLKKIRSEWD